MCEQSYIWSYTVQLTNKYEALPILLRLERDLYWFVNHVHDEAVLVPSGGTIIQVLPHGHVRWKHRVVVKEETVETRIIFKRTAC